MRFVLTKKAPAPVGPYSQAVFCDPYLFGSGQIPLDLKGQIVGEDIKTQAHQVFRNIKAVLEEEGLGFEDIIKNTVFLINMKEFSDFNEVYMSYFSTHKPARSCVEVRALPKGVLVEVEFIAFKKKS